MVFLEQKTKGQKLFLKYDKVQYDKQNALYVYLYLKNRIFVNAHLIKNGLVQVDRQMEYNHKDKFIQLEKTHQ